MRYLPRKEVVQQSLARLGSTEEGGEGMSGNKNNHAPCKYRRRETINGVELDMCYAIGFERIGDLPCEYCGDRKEMKEVKK